MADGQVLRLMLSVSPKGVRWAEAGRVLTWGSAKDPWQGELATAWRPGGSGTGEVARLPGPGDTGPVGPGEILNFILSTGNSVERILGQVAGGNCSDPSAQTVAVVQPGVGGVSLPHLGVKLWACLLPPCLVPKSCGVSPTSQMCLLLVVGTRLPFWLQDSGQLLGGLSSVTAPSLSLETFSSHSPLSSGSEQTPPQSLGLEAPTWPVNCSPHSASEALPHSGALPAHVPAPPKLPPPVTRHTQVLVPASRAWNPGRAQSKCPAGVCMSEQPCVCSSSCSLPG